MMSERKRTNPAYPPSMIREMSPLLLFLLLGCPGEVIDDDDSTLPEAGPAPCYAWSQATSTGTVEDSGLAEISGVVASRANPGVLWVHQDSGDGALITALGQDGATLGVITLANVVPADHEDIALGACRDGDGWCLLLGDFGDNGLQRDSYAIRRIDEPDVSGLKAPWALEVTPENLIYTYPEGPQNAEALAVSVRGEPIVITKRSDGNAWLYVLPASGWGEVREAERVATFAMGPDAGLIDSVTAADMTRDGASLLLRTYSYLRYYDLREHELSNIGSTTTRELLVGVEMQGEAVGWDDDERAVLHVGEATNATIYRLECTSPP